MEDALVLRDLEASNDPRHDRFPLPHIRDHSTERYVRVAVNVPFQVFKRFVGVEYRNRIQPSVVHSLLVRPRCFRVPDRVQVRVGRDSMLEPFQERAILGKVDLDALGHCREAA